MTDRQLRLLRAAAASSVATLLAAVSHTIAGGAAPHPLLLAAVSCLLIPLAALLIGARPSRSRVALTVVVSQTVFHAIFQTLGTPTAGAAPVMAPHAHHFSLADLGQTGAIIPMDAVMIGGHAVAAALTILLLCHGESLVRAISGWVRAQLRRAVDPFHPVLDHPGAPVAAVTALFDATLASSVSRRGPPALA